MMAGDFHHQNMQFRAEYEDLVWPAPKLARRSMELAFGLKRRPGAG